MSELDALATIDRSPLPVEDVSAHALRRPFFLAGHGDKARTGVLVIHGFSGTPFEVRPLGESLAARGYTVHAPRLTGHGLDAEALAQSTYEDWIASVDAGYRLLRREVDRVYVAGLSLGGLLTLDLSRRLGEEIFAIAVLAAPLWLTRGPELAIKITRRVGRTPRVTIPKLAGSDIADPAMRRRNNLAQGNVGLPIPAVMSLRDFMDRVRSQLGNVRAPALLVHAPQDHTAPYPCMAALKQEIGSSLVETIDAPRSFHVLTLDYDREAIADSVASHLERHVRV